MKGSRDTVIRKGITQVVKYADWCNAEEIYLIIFDNNKEKSWDEKIFIETVENDGYVVKIFGM